MTAGQFDLGYDLKVKPKFSVGAEASNEIAVAIQLYDRENGTEISERVGVMFYLSSDANGDAVASAPDGGIAVGTDGLMHEWTANVAGMLISEADGDIDIVLTESSTGTWYLILVMPDGKLYASGAITFS